MMDCSDFVLKLTSDDDCTENATRIIHKEFRRVRLSQIGGAVSQGVTSRPKVEVTDDCYACLGNFASKYFASDAAPTAKIRLSYKDEEDDWVVLGSAEELQDAIMMILDRPNSPPYLVIRVKIADLASKETVINTVSMAVDLQSTKATESKEPAANTVSSKSMARDGKGLHSTKSVVPVASSHQTSSIGDRARKLAACCFVVFCFLALELVLDWTIRGDDSLPSEEYNCSMKNVPVSCTTRSSGASWEVCALRTSSSASTATTSTTSTKHPLQTAPSQSSASSSSACARDGSQGGSDSLRIDSSSATDSPGTESMETSTSSSQGSTRSGSTEEGTSRTPNTDPPENGSKTSSTPSSRVSTRRTATSERAERKKRDAEFLKKLFSDILDGEGPSSPFTKAYHWIRGDPRWKHYPKERLRQRLGLATFYYATNGEESWKRSDNWLSHQINECGWWPGGFTMSICGEDNDNNNNSNSEGKHWKYERLWLPNNGLEGSLPPKLFQLLPSLRHIRLDRNIWLSGNLPSELGFLTQIQSMWFHHNMFQGTIPPELGRLSTLEKLCLAENDLSGTIPPNMFENLSNLSRLWLDHNRLKGPIPSEIGMAPLVKLNLSHNHFAVTGGIAASLLGSMTHLVHLVAPISSSTSMEEELIIPTEVGLLTNLRHLDMFVSPAKWYSLDSHKWGRSEVATLYNLETLRVGTEGNDDELIDLMTL